MSVMTVSELWNRLASAGYVRGEQPAVIEQGTPWFVRVMLGFAGWIGALFLLGFFGFAMEHLLRYSSNAVFLGCMTCAAAAGIFYLAKNDFAVQFGLALSFAGQALFIVGLLDVFKNSQEIGFLCVMLFEALLAVSINNAIHRVASAFGAAVALSLALIYFKVPGLAITFITPAIVVVWLNELKWARYGSLVRPIGYGLVIAGVFVMGALLLHATSWLFSRPEAGSKLSLFAYWCGVVINGGLLIFVVARLLAREGFYLSDKSAVIALMAAVAISISAGKAPGIATCLIIILLGFANGNRLLTGLGMAASIAYLSFYYYQLQTTLLVKSAVLVATGAILLIARFALVQARQSAARNGGGHA